MSEKEDDPKHHSSDFLLNELTDSVTSSEADADADAETSSKSSYDPSVSGEFFLPSDSQQSSEQYEQDAISKILEIKAEVENIEQQIAEYNSEELRRGCKKIEEILIQKTLTLDNIDTKSLESVKELRKNTVVYVQNCLRLMDAKLK